MQGTDLVKLLTETLRSIKKGPGHPGAEVFLRCRDKETAVEELLPIQTVILEDDLIKEPRAPRIVIVGKSTN
jgi:hypothetical protein